MKREIILLSILTLLFSSCSNKIHDEKNKIIIIQPFQDFDTITSALLKDYLVHFNRSVILSNSIQFPLNGYVKERNRYRADTLIHYLSLLHNQDTISVGITNTDISTTKGEIKDWGVMGLGYRPGNACVISTFRLNPKNKFEQFKKVVLHEIGHTLGLNHCPIKSCLMRDAEGGNPLNDEKDFCKNCKSTLRKNGFGR